MSRKKAANTDGPGGNTPHNGIDSKEIQGLIVIG